MNCCVVIDAITDSSVKLHQFVAKFDHEGIFGVSEDEPAQTMEIADWRNRQVELPEDPVGPGLMEEGLETLVAQRYKLMAYGEGGCPCIDEISSISSQFPEVKILLSYLYYDPDDIGEVGFCVFEAGKIIDNEQIFWNDDADEFRRLGNIWLGWNFPEET